MMIVNSLKSILRRREDTFWRVIFPLALMTLFFFTFGSIGNIENTIDMRKIGIVEDGMSDYAQGFLTVLEELEASYEEGNTELPIALSYMDETDAKEALNDGLIDAAYIVSEEDIEIYLGAKHDDTTGMIVRKIADSYNLRYEIVSDAIKVDPKIIEGIIEEISSEKTYFAESNETDYKDSYNWYFISTVVMGIMFNFMMGISILSNIRADVSPKAARVGISPESKIVLITREFFAALIVALVVSLIHLLSIRFLFGYHIFRKPVLMIIAVILSNAFSIALGIVLGSLFKGNESQRQNKVLPIIMIMEFLSGEMVFSLPGVIEAKLPFVNDILPSTVIKLIFYRLITWEEIGDLYINFAKLGIATVILIIISAYTLRRETYESI